MAQIVKPEVMTRCATCQARANCLFLCLAPEQFKRFAAIACPVSRKKDEVLFYEGEKFHGIYNLCSGQVRLLTTTAAAKVIPVGIAQPGDILGAMTVFSGGDFPVTAKAIGQCELEYLNKADFLKFVEGTPDLKSKLLQKLSAEWIKLKRLVAELKGEPAIQRLERLLLHLCESSGEPTAKGANVNLELALKGEELAEMLGVSREWASKLMTQLKQKYIIKVKRGKVLVINKAALERDLK